MRCRRPSSAWATQRLTRVSIFLSVFDVHINRSPCAGTVDVVAYRPGKFVNAAADKASEDNERMAIALQRADGVTVGFVQIAGWVARRIVCYVKPGQAWRQASASAISASAAAPTSIFRSARGCWWRRDSA